VIPRLVSGSYRWLVCAGALWAAAGACFVHDPPHGVEETCAVACEANASRCTVEECRRGCNMVIDRLVEGEMGAVLACIASSSAKCGDVAWARCGARIGPHSDGGPPAPVVSASPEE
jgi:hypothetical protein